MFKSTLAGSYGNYIYVFKNLPSCFLEWPYHVASPLAMHDCSSSCAFFSAFGIDTIVYSLVIRLTTTTTTTTTNNVQRLSQYNIRNAKVAFSIKTGFKENM